MTYSLTEVARLLGFALEDARAWVRELGAMGPVERDDRGARRLSEAQVVRVSSARVVALSLGCSRREALERVRRLEASDEQLRALEGLRESLGLPALEERLASLEAAVRPSGRNG